MLQPKLHFTGICGKAMGSIAAALAREGWRVTGSDENAYPPMSAYLAENNVAISPPVDEHANLPGADLFIIGKRIAQGQPELERIMREGRAYCSFPAFLQNYFLNYSRNAVVAGGVGKTTTTAMLTWLLEHAGHSPDYVIGGECRNLPHPARLAGAQIAVLEGDEYASCFDDPRPKFMHYAASIGVVTNLIEDHPDLFAGDDELFAVFATWVRALPPWGCLILPDHDKWALRLAGEAACRVEIVGFSQTATQRITDLRLHETGAEFQLRGQDFTLPMFGRMNVRNAAMAIIAATAFSVSEADCAKALAEFQGVGNRQQGQEVGACTAVLDKATHPAALRELYQAVRQRYPGRRLVSVIQPRATGGREWVYQRELPAALAEADLVLITRPYEHKPRPGQTWPGGAFSTDDLVAAVREAGVQTLLLENPELLGPALLKAARAGDVVVVTLPEQALALRQVILENLPR